MITLRKLGEIEGRANALRAAISHLRNVLCDAMTCSCYDAYTSCGMVDPGCRYHEFEDAVKFLAQVEGATT